MPRIRDQETHLRADLAAVDEALTVAVYDGDTSPYRRSRG